MKCERLPKDQATINNLKTHHQDYIISNGLLCHVSKHIQNSDNYQQICVPIEFRSEIMKINHDLKTSGHVGAFKMYNKERLRFVWIGMYGDIQNYVSSCKLCMQTNTGNLPRVALKPLLVATEPYASIHLDLLRFYTPSNCLPTPMTLASGGGESDVPACDPPTSFSVHLASSAVTPTGSVHKFRGDNVVRMWVHLKRCCVSCV